MKMTPLNYLISENNINKMYNQTYRTVHDILSTLIVSSEVESLPACAGDSDHTKYGGCDISKHPGRAPNSTSAHILPACHDSPCSYISVVSDMLAMQNYPLSYVVT